MDHRFSGRFKPLSKTILAKKLASPNPSLHPTFASRLRRLAPAGDLKR